MKAGFYKNDMQEIEADSVNEAAESFAEEHHQIDEQSDMKFTIYVEDDNGMLFEIKMYTEYDPRFEVESSSIIPSK